MTDPPAAAGAADAKLADAAKPAKAKAAAAKTAKTATKPKATAQPAASDKPKTTAKKAAKPAKAKAGDAATAKAPAAKKPATKPAAKAAAKPVAADGKPDLLTAARAGGPDDLQQIKGVGPKLEAELHKVGVYHFDQVAAWRKKEVTWMDENLAGVRNRVSRDDWVSQAKILAKGGQTEFSKRVTKGDVY